MGMDYSFPRTPSKYVKNTIRCFILHKTYFRLTRTIYVYVRVLYDKRWNSLASHCASNDARTSLVLRSHVFPIKYTLERLHVESHWTAIFQQGGSIIADKVYRLRWRHVITQTHTQRPYRHEKLFHRSLFMYPIIVPFVHRGWRITYNKSIWSTPRPRPYRPWKHRVPLSGQCFVSPGARRPAVPEAERQTTDFLFLAARTGVRDPGLCREATRQRRDKIRLCESAFRISVVYFTYFGCNTSCKTSQGAQAVWQWIKNVRRIDRLYDGVSCLNELLIEYSCSAVTERMKEKEG